MVQFASYLGRVLHKTRLISSVTNGPIVIILWFIDRAWAACAQHRASVACELVYSILVC